VIDMFVHAADVSNPAKEWTSCKSWSFLIMDEFWAQGDRERDMVSSTRKAYFCYHVPDPPPPPPPSPFLLLLLLPWTPPLFRAFRWPPCTTELAPTWRQHR
jgi:hypothetical protein